MDEHVLVAIVRGDEAVALVGAEPLHVPRTTSRFRLPSLHLPQLRHERAAEGPEPKQVLARTHCHQQPYQRATVSHMAEAVSGDLLVPNTVRDIVADSASPSTIVVSAN
jgi:hypothetical protein